jgi:uncharacterized membrane protein
MAFFSRLVVSALFLSSGVLHFVKPDIYEKIVPPALPNAQVLVAVSGAAEIAGALGLWVPAARRFSAYGLVALLFAVFPANAYMAIEHERFARVAPAWLLYARLPLQVVLVAWVVRLRD